MRVIKTATVAVLLLSFMVPLLSIGTTQACWWRRPLRAKMNLDLGNARPVKEGEPGFGGEFPALLTWTGSISGGVNGYMRFFLTNYQVEGKNDEWGHYWEVWQIFDEEDGVLLMEGYDEGYTHLTKGYYGMVGKVTYTSSAFSRWQGHTVFMHGIIIPPSAEWETSPEIPIAPGSFYVF